MTLRRGLAVHALASLVVLLLVANATARPWVAQAVADATFDGLVRRWLLGTLALGALAGAAVLVALPARRRPTFIVRQAALALSVPVVLLVLRATPGVVMETLGALYVGLIAALALHLLAGVWHTLATTGDRRIAGLLAIVGLAATLALLPYHRAVQPTESDEPHYMVIMQSLIYDRDLDLRNDYEGDRYLEFYPARLPDMHGIERGPGVYPIRDLGLPLVALVPFALAGHGGVLVLICAFGAALTAQLFLLLRDLGFRRETAFLATALAAFTHPLLTYTTQVYPELAIALLFAVIARLMRRGRATGWRTLAVASALVALLPLLSTRAWLIAAPVALLIGLFGILAPVSLAERARRAIAAGGPFLAIIGLLALANGVMFGVFLPSAGYYIIRDQQQVLAYTPHVGGLGLWFDRAFGLIGRAPIYLLALLGLGALWARRRTQGATLLILAAGWLSYFVYIASIAYWFAEGSPASRYLLGSFPFLVVALAGGLEAIARLPHVLRTGLVALLGGASAFVTYVFAVLPHLRYDIAQDIRQRAGSGQLWEFLGGVLGSSPGAALPSMVSLDPRSVALAFIWTAVALGLVVAGFVLAARPATAPASPAR